MNDIKITYDEVRQYHDQMRYKLESYMDRLDKDLVEKRDSGTLPIYLTKWRVKSVDSIYLKTKRKNKKTLDEITDYGGFRILCMFEQDLDVIHNHLLKKLVNDGDVLTEFFIFNHKDETSKENLANSVRDAFSDPVPDIDTDKDSDSGYRSLHYVVTHNDGGGKLKVEIQLRTLLQDAWGELEHKLAYKQGTINPHIKKSFSLLAEELSNIDRLVTHLRDIKEKEDCVESYELLKNGPSFYFKYNDNGIIKGIEKVGKGEEVRKYFEFMDSPPSQDELVTWLKKGEAKLKVIRENFLHKELMTDDINYFFRMESAYFNFYKGNLQDSLNEYEEISKEYDGYYLPFFRRGDIFFAQGKIREALVEFDKCEEKIEALEYIDPVVHFRLKLKMALEYWLLGKEYFNIALSEAQKALNILESNRGSFTDAQYGSVLNNTCYYALEYSLSEDNENDRLYAEDMYRKLLDFVNKSNNFNSNICDTLSWYNFKQYERTKNKNFLIEAKKFNERGWGMSIMTTNKINSSNLIRIHLQELLRALQEEGL